MKKLTMFSIFFRGRHRAFFMLGDFDPRTGKTTIPRSTYEQFCYELNNEKK